MISASDVKALRERTGLPLMDCKRALTECDGDAEQAVQWLRERGAKLIRDRSDRETGFGRFGLCCGSSEPVGAIVELLCESAPVTHNEEFIQLANDLAAQLARGPGAETAEELLAQPSPSQPGVTLAAQKDELFNRIREVFRVGRIARLKGTCGGYSHNAGTVAGVLLQVEGANDEASRDICMHIAAMRPDALVPEDLDPAVIEKERGIQREIALKEGKPESIVDKMVEGRLRSFFAERVLTEQRFVKDDKQTVGQYAQQNGLKLLKFVHWELGS